LFVWLIEVVLIYLLTCWNIRHAHYSTKSGVIPSSPRMYLALAMYFHILVWKRDH
jgi:hypothetical protein